MKKPKRLFQAVKKAPGTIIDQGEDGFACQIVRVTENYQYVLCVILSWGGGWDHVSVHARSLNQEQFTPFWEDMCYVKSLFFKPCETGFDTHVG